MARCGTSSGDCQARGGALRGLHVLANGSEKARQYGQQVLDDFYERARELGVMATGRIVQGDVVEKI